MHQQRSQEDSYIHKIANNTINLRPCTKTKQLYIIIIIIGTWIKDYIHDTVTVPSYKQSRITWGAL